MRPSRSGHIRHTRLCALLHTACRLAASDGCARTSPRLCYGCCLLRTVACRICCCCRSHAPGSSVPCRSPALSLRRAHIGRCSPSGLPPTIRLRRPPSRLSPSEPRRSTFPRSLSLSAPDRPHGPPSSPSCVPCRCLYTSPPLPHAPSPWRSA